MSSRDVTLHTPEIDSHLARLASMIGRAKTFIERDLIRSEYHRLKEARRQLQREHRERGRQPGIPTEQTEGPGGTMRDDGERPVLLVCEVCGAVCDRRHNGRCDDCCFNDGE